MAARVFRVTLFLELLLDMGVISAQERARDQSAPVAERTQDLRQRLRERTSLAHARLEQTLAAAGQFDTREGYARYLTRWRVLQAGAEQALSAARAASVIPDWPQRRRRWLIDEDLRWLGCRVIDGPGERLSVEGAADIFGIAYVLEGS